MVIKGSCSEDIEVAMPKSAMTRRSSFWPSVGAAAAEADRMELLGRSSSLAALGLGSPRVL
jgi:hypothetical protein